MTKFRLYEDCSGYYLNYIYGTYKIGYDRYMKLSECMISIDRNGVLECGTNESLNKYIEGCKV